MHKKRTLCVVPARSGSKGLPGKNIKLLGDFPLLSYPIMSAKKSKFVDRIICSTDSEAYASLARKYGAETPFLRSTGLSGDEVNSVEVVLDVIDKCELNHFDYVIMLEPTSPFTSHVDIDNALSLLDSFPEYSSLVSVSKSISGHPHFTFGLSKNHKLVPYESLEWKFMRRQEISPLFFQDGSLYISRIGDLFLNKSFITSNTMGFVVPKWKSLEIDDELDFRIAESILDFQTKKDPTFYEI